MILFGLTTIDKILHVAGIEIPVKSEAKASIQSAVVHLTESEISVSSPQTRMKLIPDFEKMPLQVYGRHVLIPTKLVKNLKSGKLPSLFEILYTNKITLNHILDCGNAKTAGKVRDEIKNLSL